MWGIPCRPWTVAESNHLRDLVAAGRTRTQIAEIMGKTPYAIDRRRRRMNLQARLNPFAWTDERIAELTRLWTLEKKSARAIAEEFSNKYDHPLSRNAIIGKVGRLGLGRPEPPERNSARNRGNGNKKNKFKYHRLPGGQFVRRIWPAAAPSTSGIKFFDIGANQCRFIAGDPCGEQTLFCGAPVPPDLQSYCPHHWRGCRRP